jgi:nucleotide-binding universal stress UspA family protein
LLKEKYLQDLEVQTVVIHGKCAEEIVGVSEQEKADVIVIATHGESGWRKFLFGSICEKVIKLAECPILAIPKPD